MLSGVGTKIPYAMGTIQKLYERRLMNAIGRDSIAKYIILALTENDLLPDDGVRKLRSFADWCYDLGVETISIYVSIIADEFAEAIYSKLSKRIPDTLSDEFNLFIYSKFRSVEGKKGDGMRINVSIGFGGRAELTDAIRKIMEKVENGAIEPSEIDENTIESHLVFKSEPDLIIRSGGRLTDFLIWQSVYSELYFTEVNWMGFRKIDLLRAIRDFQKRKRRFGK
jgi:undecaprenyl diphosphate synthase